jgi:hypothetical protein
MRKAVLHVDNTGAQISCECWNGVLLGKRGNAAFLAVGVQVSVLTRNKMTRPVLLMSF